MRKKNNYNQKDEKLISLYLREVFGRIPVYDFEMIKQVKTVICGNRDVVPVTDNGLIRKLCFILGKEYLDYRGMLDEAQKLMAFKDGLFYLAQKKIPVYFVHRVDWMEGYKYSETALRRMNEKRSFPLMCKSIQEYEPDLRELFGDKYSIDYVEQMSKIPQVVKIGNRYCHEDYKSTYINVINGKRITVGQPQFYRGTLHIYGRCGVFGYAVEDCDTFPSLVQCELNNRGLSDIRVVNHGLWGGDDEMIDHNFLFELQGFEEGDIVLFYRYHFDSKVIKWLEECGLNYEDVTREWHSYAESRWCFYDKPGHMNKDGYKNLAEVVVNRLIKNGLYINDSAISPRSVSYLHSYIEINDDIDFEKKINEYIDFVKSVKTVTETDNGAIVMNCNPFTFGHRFLIEYAAKRVDWLYIFVVEENKSFFEFEDRMTMVKNGTADIDNVIVVPSGRFMISSYTFPEYFMKDYVKTKDFDVSNDVNIFCKEIAPKLSIKKRFVGEEPFDPVTANYNETMKKAFPSYGIELVEIPRKRMEDSTIINATAVRMLIETGDIEKISDYVPITTSRIIRDKYIKN